jgi:hypothetical protein
MIRVVGFIKIFTEREEVFCLFCLFCFYEMPKVGNFSPPLQILLRKEFLLNKRKRNPFQQISRPLLFSL